MVDRQHPQRTRPTSSYPHGYQLPGLTALASACLCLCALASFAGFTPLLKLLAANGTIDTCALDYGRYKLPLWTNPNGETAGRKCLLQTPRLRVDHHTRQIEPGKAGGGARIEDWLWLDYGDRVNVLVQLTSGDFQVFSQTKYALEGESLAVVGGFIEPGETPIEAAHREVLEEMQLVCRATHLLGRFRTDVNRGMGWVSSLLMQGCGRAPPSMLLTSDDQEKQQPIRMSLAELETAALNARFVEVQWCNTVAMGLLKLGLQSRATEQTKHRSNDGHVQSRQP